MPRTYEHLNSYEREVIAQMLKEKYSLISNWPSPGPIPLDYLARISP
ncbi:MAG: hypothetical protein GKR87_16230 [Kiritimatiellae bacterium]|nr:hypothetical protein [Kiritimatiellia bacterium]